MVNYACVYAMQVIDTWMHRVVVASWTIGVGVAPRSLLFPYMQRGLVAMGGLCGILHAPLFVCGVDLLETARIHSIVHSFISLNHSFAPSLLLMQLTLPLRSSTLTFLPFAGWLSFREASRFSCKVFFKIWDSGFFVGLFSDTPHPFCLFSPFRRLFSLVFPFPFPRGPDDLMAVSMQRTKLTIMAMRISLFSFSFSFFPEPSRYPGRKEN